jgi:hypothetical protein
MFEDHRLTTLDVVGRRIHPFEARIIDACLRRDMLVRMCTCGFICAGATMFDVLTQHESHQASVRV